MLTFGLAGCVAAPAAPPAEEPAAPTVTIEQATLPVYALASDPAVRVAIRAPRETPYRPTIVGSRPVTVQLELGNAGATPIDLAGARLVFEVRRGAVRIPCAARNDIPEREPVELSPGHKAVLVRDLCSLPLPGDYDVAAWLTLPGTPPAYAGSFPIGVVARGPNVPRKVARVPGLWAAMGGDVTGMRFTKPEWASGAYHVIVRLTNASSVPTLLGPAQVVFRVTQHGHPLACTASHDLVMPDGLAPGRSWVQSVPVTCLIDVEGRYEIHASLAMGDEETPLGDIAVEVTSNPLLYLPVIPW